MRRTELTRSYKYLVHSMQLDAFERQTWFFRCKLILLKRKLNSFHANLNSTKPKLEFHKTQTWILKNWKLEFNKRKTWSVLLKQNLTPQKRIWIKFSKTQTWFHKTKTWISNFVKSKHETWLLYIYHMTLLLRCSVCDHVKRSRGKVAWWVQKLSISSILSMCGLQKGGEFK